MKREKFISLIVFMLFQIAATVNARVVIEEADLDQLLKLDLRKLMNVKISLASRTEEPQFRSAGAVYVLTAEDIERSGYRRLPEILRMVPGLHVAKIDANKWAVSIRNSQTRFSSTMLVMIDGRHVYTPFFAGVYWEIQDTFVEDIERIEVIRGPGGSLWGANAVDGIINIITKSSANTQGAKAYSLVGQGEMKYEVGLRYGGRTTSGVNYRFFAKNYQSGSGEYIGPSESTNNGLVPIGMDANDKGDAKQLGFRMDWSSGRDNYTFQGNAYRGDFNEDRILNGMRIPNILRTESHNLILKWKRALSNTESIVVNAYYDQISRDDGILQNDEATFDVDLQHNLIRGDHNLTWGLGYRYYDNKARITDPSSCAVTMPCFGVDPPRKSVMISSAFMQDRIAMSETFALIIGSKFEKNDYTGFEYQPTLRGLWTPDNDTTYWGGVTRAVRAPDRVSTDGILNFGNFTVPIGNKNERSFTNYTYELGYRNRISNRWIMDGTVFYSDYRGTIQGGSTTGTDNIYGVEGYVKYQYSPKLRMELGYTYHKGKTVLAGGGNRPRTRLPKHMLYLRSYYNFGKTMELDALVYYVDVSKSISGRTDIPAYTRLDLRYGWRPLKRLDVSLLLTNMLVDTHAEGIDATKINTGVKPGMMLKLTYTTNR